MKESTKIMIAMGIAIIGAILVGYGRGVVRQIEYSIPPAFACNGENCFPTYKYETNYEQAFKNCQAAMKYQLSN